MANKKLKEQQNKTNVKEKTIIKKSTLIKILSVTLACLFFLFCVAFVIDTQAPANPKDYHVFCLSAFKGSFDKKGNPNNYWKVQKQRNTDGEDLTLYVQTEIVGSYKNLNEIWVNLSDFYETQTVIEVKNGSSRDVGSFKLHSDDLKQSQHGWFKIYDADDIDDENGSTTKSLVYGEISIGFKTQINVREIVYLKADGTVIDYKIEGEKTVAGLIDVDDEKITSNPNSILNVKDEQSTFKSSIRDND